MSHNIESITSAKIGLALDAAVLRQQAIASNIANVNTEGYVPMRLSFASQLEQLQADFSNNSFSAGQMFAPKLELEPVLDRDGNPAKVELDAEVVAMAHNSVQYQALLKGLSRHYSIMSTAVSEGKR